MSWVNEFIALAQRKEQFVSITVIEVIGSAPREVGAKMLVTENMEFESIGGGNLEYSAIRRARDILREPMNTMSETEMFGLGIEMQQCCGGAVRLLYEKHSVADATAYADEFNRQNNRTIMFFASPLEGDQSPVVLNNKTDWNEVSESLRLASHRLLETVVPGSCLVSDDSQEWFVMRLDELPTKVVLFGAGHVGQALVRLLGDLPFRVEWVDQRAEIFPDNYPNNVVLVEQTNLQEILVNQEPGTFYVVMTHSHGLDYEICLSILKQRDFGWLGLIGSETKRRRFEKRFVAEGIDPFTLRRLHCPIGIGSIKGKHPAVIAMSTAAQLLEARQCELEALSSHRKTVTQKIDSSVS